jgi:hypothetical protein
MKAESVRCFPNCKQKITRERFLQFFCEINEIVDEALRPLTNLFTRRIVGYFYEKLVNFFEKNRPKTVEKFTEFSEPINRKY